MISVNQLSKVFNDFTAVDNLSFDLAAGDIVGFLGPNGAGKSTTMKMLTGFIEPSQGSINVNGLNFQQHRKRIQSTMGYLPEGAPSYGEMTVYQFLHFIAEIRAINAADRQKAIHHVMDKVALKSVANKPIENLSKGFKRRVGLAQALIHDPQILILDEPTDGLDPNQKHQVRELIKALSSDKIVVISTHILEEVQALCNRTMIIAKGQKRFDGTPEELLAHSEQHNAVKLTLSNPSDATAFDGIQGVKEILKDEATKTITLLAHKGHTIIEDVSHRIHLNNISIEELTVESGQLDQVFRQLTSDGDDELKAQEDESQ